MGKILPSKVQEIVFASSDKAESRRITALLKEGQIRKIAPRVYTSNFSDEPTAIIKRNWFHILSALYPEALLSHRSALEFVPTSNGHVFLTYTYTEKVQLPGLTIRLLKGPATIEGDNVFFGNLHASQEARAFLENLQETRRKSAEPKTLIISQIEERLEAIIRARGENGLNVLRDKAKEISSRLGMENEFKKLNKLISDLLPTENLRQAGLATRKSKSLTSPAAIARSLGEPLDPDRIELFESLYEELAGKVFPQHIDQNTSVKAYKTFAFFEGYFSNFIEGTEFTVEEAKEIIETDTPLPARDEDSHDILGTYRIVSDKKEMAICPSNANEFLDIMRRRHAAIARSLGEPLDPDRIELFESLYEELAGKVFPQHIDQNTSVKAYKTFAFFEGYFSNFIEGTEFTVEEAKEIIETDTPLPARDEDSHDILGTYRIVSDKKEMAICPSNANEFLDIMRRRHAILLQSRISKKPGEFKDKNNRAGNTEFVDKQLVVGTLKKGFEWYSLLQEPFAKAVYMMFLVSEVHPFLDGNGRIARVMMNAELSAKGLSKIIIPTVYREDYMGALRKLTRHRVADAYVRMLLHAYEFSSTLVGDSINEMEKHLIECDAFKEPKEGKLKILARSN